MPGNVLNVIDVFAFITNIKLMGRKEGGKEGRKEEKEKSVIDWKNTSQHRSVFVILMWIIIYRDMNYVINKDKRIKETMLILRKQDIVFL